MPRDTLNANAGQWVKTPAAVLAARYQNLSSISEMWVWADLSASASPSLAGAVRYRPDAAERASVLVQDLFPDLGGAAAYLYFMWPAGGAASYAYA